MDNGLRRWIGKPLSKIGLLALNAARAPQKTVLSGDISRDLGRILRPQAAYRWMLPQLAAITPQYIEMTLRGALAGSHVQAWELFDLMEDTWPRLTKNLNDIKRAVSGLDWKLNTWQEEDEPPTDSAKEKMRLVSSALWKMRPDPAADENALKGTIYDILDAWGKGLTVLEIDWEMRQAGKLGSIIAPRSTFWVHPTCYTWSMEGKLGLRTELAAKTNRKDQWPNSTYSSTSFNPLPAAVDDFPPDKFLIAISKAKSGSPLGGALLRSLAWWWCASNFSADWLLNLAQIFALPIRWATYQQGAPQSTIDQVCSMLENLGNSAWAAFPEGTRMELKEAQKSAGDSPQAEMIDRADKQADLLILGQTLTSDVSKSGGSRALGDVHMSVRGDIVQAAADFAAEVLNRQMIPSIVRLNYDTEDEAPEISAAPHKQEDQLANAQRDQVLIESGVEMPKEWFYKRHDIPLPQPDEETIGAPAAPEPKPGEEPDQPEKLDPKIIAAKDAGGSSGFEASALHALALAVATDLEPVNARLAAIAQIQDPDLRQAKMISFIRDLDKMKADVGQDSETSRALQNIIATGLANGIAANSKHS